MSCPFEESWHVHNVTSSDGNSSDEAFFYFHKGFINQLLYVPQRKKSRHLRSGDLVYETVVETEDLVARIAFAAVNIADTPEIF